MTSPTSVRSRRPILLALFIAAALVVAALALRLATPPRSSSTAPTPNPTPTVLHLKGTGDLTAPAFTTGPDWAVSYTLDCPTGGTLRIVETGGVLNGVPIVASTTSMGNATAYIHDAPGLHSLRIESGCAWTVTVVDGDKLPRATSDGAA